MPGDGPVPPSLQRTKASKPTELPLDALEIALWTRALGNQLDDGLALHAYDGSRYTAIRYNGWLADAGAVPSIGTVGDSYKNALAQTTIRLHKTECVLHEGPWRGADELELTTSNWVW